MAGQAGPSAAVSTTQAAIEELQEMALDPALEDCCRRDIEQQIKSERIRQTLQREDRVEARQRMAASAIRRDASATPAAEQLQPDSRAPGQQQPHAQHEHHMQQQQQQQEGQSDDEGELQRLRQQRLRQLQAESAVKREQRREGFGVLNTLPESSVLRLCCQDPPGRGLVVLHLAVQGYEPSNTLDEILEKTADQNRGTYFARSLVSRSSPLIAQLQLPHGVPALLVAKHCALLGKAHINQFGGADIWEEQVLAYLQRFKVLSTGGSGTAAAAAQHEESSGEEGGDSDEEAAEWQTPCEVCGRTYPHEHIRSIYSSHQQDSSDEEDM